MKPTESQPPAANRRTIANGSHVKAPAEQGKPVRVAVHGAGFRAQGIAHEIINSV